MKKIKNVTEQMIAVGKRIGFSLDEIGELTTQMLIDIISTYGDSGEDKGYRKATQADIDRYFG